MRQTDLAVAPPDAEKPIIDLSLNNGVHCSTRCLEVLQTSRRSTDLRSYSDAENSKLKEAVAKDCGVSAANVFLHNGSGPILKQYIPETIRRNIKASPWRVLKHLARGSGYPLITPTPTYDKVMKGAAAAGLLIREVALRPATFKLDVSRLVEALQLGDGLVYLCNPNNPTGTVLIDRRELMQLAQRFPGSTFLIDEAYVHYLDPKRHEYLANLAETYPNVVCLRTFSFAYGLASAHVGFLIAHESEVQRLEKHTTAYRIPAITEALAVAALEDTKHLETVRLQTEAGRDQLRRGIQQHPELTPYPSETNFILVRVENGISPLSLGEALKERGVLVRTFEDGGPLGLSSMFRVTVGTEEENNAFVKALAESMPKRSLRGGISRVAS